MGCNQYSPYDVIEVADEGDSLGGATVLNFVGAGVTATKAGSTVSIAIPGGGGSGSFEIVDYTDFEDDGLPTGVPANYIARLVFADPDYQQTIGGVQYFNNKIIYFTGTHWISWAGDYGTPT